LPCPYLDCREQRELPAGAESCPSCLRLVKICPHCAAANRAFANFCRACGRALPEATGEWPTFKGGPQRLGLNRWPQARQPMGGIEEILELRLDSPCRSLLSSDRHLIAVSQAGGIEVVDAARGAASSVRTRTDGPVSAEPCVSQGTLFVPAPGCVTAFALGGLHFARPRLEQRWEVRLPGVPIHALLALEGYLYLDVLLPEGSHEVCVISDVGTERPGELRRLLSAQRVSWSAANPPSRQVFWLTEEDGELKVHCHDHSAPAGPALTTRPVAAAPLPLADSVPIAVMGAKLFAVLGNEDTLCRLDARDGVFDLALRADLRSYALSGMRDGLLVDARGLYFLGAQHHEQLPPMVRVKGSPVVLQDRAAAVGLQDGRVRLYDLHALPLHDEFRVSQDTEELTALMSFRRFVAAGDEQGAVKVVVLADRGGRLDRPAWT
jgi:hypothetical protein